MIGENVILEDKVFCIQCGKTTEHQIVSEYLSDTNTIEYSKTKISYEQKELVSNENKVYEPIDTVVNEETDTYFIVDTYKQIIICNECREKKASLRIVTHRHNRKISVYETIKIEPFRRDRVINKEYKEYLQDEKFDIICAFAEAINAYNNHLEMATLTLLGSVLQHICIDRNHSDFEEFKLELLERNFSNKDIEVIEDISFWVNSSHKKPILEAFDEADFRIQIDTFDHVIKSLYLEEVKKQRHSQMSIPYNSKSRRFQQK